MSDPDLSVALVTHNGRELALATLRSALARVGEVDVEWLVVDNGSSDGTPEAIEHEHSAVQVFRAPNLGFAHGNNVAIRRARGRYVLLMNPDVEIVDGTLGDLVVALDARPDVGAASVVQRGSDGRLLPSIRRFPSPARDLGEALFAARWPVMRTAQELDLDFDSYLDERSADWLSGAFLIVRREALDGVGPMDDRFFLYSEEIDWCYRMRGAGWDVRHLPVMEVTHHCGGSAPERVAELCRSRILFARKHFGRGRSAAIWAALTLGQALRLMLLALPATLRPAARGRMKSEAYGFAVLTGLMRAPLSQAARERRSKCAE